MLQVNLLGPVEVLRSDRAVELTSAKQRGLLAAVALARGATVSVDALTDALWEGDGVPADPKGTLQSYVSRLRARLGGDVLVHAPGGYRLDRGSVRLDLDEVEALVDRARASGDPTERAAALADALGRWRGEALHELSGSAAFAPEIARLAELRRVLTDDHLDALLEAGQVSTALPALEQAARREPLRERTQLLQVRALAQAGRSAEALRAAASFRRRLVEEAGLDAGPALAALEAQVLAGSLPSPSPSPSPSPGSAPRETAPPGTAPAGIAPQPRATAGGPRPAVAGRRSLATLPRSGRFVGREAEALELEGWLSTERLVSVVGPGGVGKTRLVAEVLDRLGEEPIVHELAGLAEGEVAPSLAAALGLQPESDMAEEAVIGHLSLEPALLVLDGGEHVLDEIRPLVRRLLGSGDGLRVLVTSRVRLGLTAEQVVPLEPLPVPGPQGGATDAVELFLDRARRADPRLALPAATDPTVAAICRRLDGVPLALELAAGRVPALGFGGLHERLDRALDLLTGPAAAGHGGVDVHRSLRGVVAWSDRLLSPDAAAVLRALSVFEAGFPLRGAEAVAGTVCDDAGLAIASLVDASLVLVDHGTGQPRYRLLDAVRQYAGEALAGSPHLDPARSAHSRWCVEVLTRTAAAVPGPDEAAALAAARSWRADLRSGLRRVLGSGDPVLVASVSGAAARVVLYHSDRGLLAWLHESADLAPELPGEHAATLLAGAARAAYLRGDLGACQELASSALDRPATPAARAVAGHALGVRCLYTGRYDEAERRWWQVVDDPEVSVADRADALAGVALARTFAGDLDGASDAAEQLGGVARSLRSDTYLAMYEYVVGEMVQASDPVDAAQRFERSIELAAPSEAAFVAGLATTALTSVLGRTGQTDQALDRLESMIGRWRRWGTWTQLWTALRLLAELLADRGEPEVAMALLDAADADPAAAAVTGADHGRLTRLRDRLVAAGVRAQAEPPSRARALEHAREALARLR